ncbi:MAG: hypothetical protein WD771_09425 [Gemmatimonadaceae bacterium]
MIRRLSRVPLLLALPVAVAIGGCGEDLETGNTCPLLCPGQEIVIRDTVIEPAYVFDSTLTGFPLQGLENTLLLSARGDTADVRAVIRFDSLPRLFLPVGGDTLERINYVDSAYLSIRVQASEVPLPASFFIEAFDVYDPTLADTAIVELAAHFNEDRLLGGVRIDTVNFSDSVRVRIPLNRDRLLAIIADDSARLRVGLRLRAPTSVQVLVASYLPGGEGAFIDFNTSPDTLAQQVRFLQPVSLTPPKPGLVTGDYVDFNVVVNAPGIFAPGTFSVGGMPAARPYLRFDLPLWLTDSVSVLKAELELTQDPLPGPNDADTVAVLVHLVLAGETVTDIYRAATLLSPGGVLTNSIVTLPSDSGLQVIKLNTLVQQWRTRDGVRSIPSALVLRTNNEGSSLLAARFFGIDAADPAVRPRLRVSYVPAFLFGSP